MARLNEILVGRFNRGLQKLYGIKGGPPVATIAPEIMPVHSIFAGVETRFADSWTRWAAGVSFGAQAGQTVGLRLRNPANSNVIAAIEKISVSSASVQEIDLSVFVSNADLTTGLPQPLDGRQPSTGGTVIQSTSVTSPGAGNIIQRVTAINQNGELINDESQEIVIAPGSFFQLTSTVVNVAVVFNIWWRERFLEESERQ